MDAFYGPLDRCGDLVDDRPDLPPGLLHPGKIRWRKLELFPIARLRAIGAILLFELGSEVRPVFDFLAQTISIELGQSHFGTHQDD